jgi:aspartyl protease
MPRLKVPIGPDGPIIDVRLWVGPDQRDVLISRGQSVPQPLSVAGLLDTGARWTAIPRVLAEEIGLRVSDWRKLSSSAFGDEEREAPVYQVRMTFGSLDAPDLPKWRTLLTVGVATIVSPGAIVLVGQDLLATCRFTYDGRKRRLMMSY